MTCCNKGEGFKGGLFWGTIFIDIWGWGDNGVWGVFRWVRISFHFCVNCEHEISFVFKAICIFSSIIVSSSS